jgi:hypothetical protein
MPRKLNEIIAHIRMVAANPNIDTTLIQTEDLEALCVAAEGGVVNEVEALDIVDRLRNSLLPGNDPKFYMLRLQDIAEAANEIARMRAR